MKKTLLTLILSCILLYGCASNSNQTSSSINSNYSNKFSASMSNEEKLSTINKDLDAESNKGLNGSLDMAMQIHTELLKLKNSGFYNTSLQNSIYKSNNLVTILQDKPKSDKGFSDFMSNFSPEVRSAQDVSWFNYNTANFDCADTCKISSLYTELFGLSSNGMIPTGYAYRIKGLKIIGGNDFDLKVSQIIPDMYNQPTSIVTYGSFTFILIGASGDSDNFINTNFFLSYEGKTSYTMNGNTDTYPTFKVIREIPDQTDYLNTLAQLYTLLKNSNNN
ncbi:hypothetical protein ACFX5K_01795 [Rickettsiales bacterium LUAb2]